MKVRNDKERMKERKKERKRERERESSKLKSKGLKISILPSTTSLKNRSKPIKSVRLSLCDFAISPSLLSSTL